jgi:hypothetical protein
VMWERTVIGGQHSGEDWKIGERGQELALC